LVISSAFAIGEIGCNVLNVKTYPVVIPTKAGRSAKRGERPKGGPEGVSEANHLS